MEPSRARALAALVAVALVASACNLIGPPPQPKLTLSVTTLSLQTGLSNSKSAFVDLTNDGNAVLDGVLTTNQPWLSVAPTSVDIDPGETDTVTVTAECGATEEVRNGTVTVTQAGGGVLGTVTVTLNCLTDPPSEFDIVFEFFGDTPPTPDQEAVFEAAAERWSSLIIGDLTSLAGNLPEDECADGQPAMPGLDIDDLLILAQVAPIDGVGGILGFAGPCVFRPGFEGLPVIGVMVFDSADVADMEADGTLQDVIMHEMGHVLGIGTLWGSFLLIDGVCNPADTVTVRRFTGVEANARHVDAGGLADNLIIEADGGPGTACGHWDEDIYDNELMTGFIAGAGNPLSAITVGSLADLGYEVSYLAADDYTVPDAGAVRTQVAKRQIGLVLRPPTRIGLD